MLVAIGLILLIVASLLFHFWSPWYFTPLASNWSTIDDTIAVTFWVTGIVFVVVNLFMAVAVIRYRYRANARALSLFFTSSCSPYVTSRPKCNSFASHFLSARPVSVKRRVSLLPSVPVSPSATETSQGGGVFVLV